MDYNAYGRSSRGSGGYFENDSIPSESRHYPVERDNLSTSHKWNHAQQRYSPPILNNDRMPPVAEPSARENVSPEVIAAITERVKREGWSLRCVMRLAALFTCNDANIYQQ